MIKSRLKKASYAYGYGLKYLLCEDWFIYSYDRDGRIYVLNTELWPEWSDVPENKQYEQNSVEKYMLPIAKERWNELSWKLTDTDLWQMWPEDQIEEKFKQYNVELKSTGNKTAAIAGEKQLKQLNEVLDMWNKFERGDTKYIENIIESFFGTAGGPSDVTIIRNLAEEYAPELVTMIDNAQQTLDSVFEMQGEILYELEKKMK